VEIGHPEISLRRQCDLLGVNRSGLYYEPTGESEENLQLMRLIDEQYTRAPFYGSRLMTEWLRTKGFEVNRKRVSRLMALMGIEAVYPKPKLSQPGEGHRIHPYLLEGMKVERVNQVWSTDITYIRMAQGFAYLVAVMDWHSRFLLSWALSLSMELDFCLEALERALRRGRPESSTAIKARSSPVRNLPANWQHARSPSVWMGGDAVWTTSSSKGWGVRSNTKRCT
jgi:putative transposase